MWIDRRPYLDRSIDIYILLFCVCVCVYADRPDDLRTDMLFYQVVSFWDTRRDDRFSLNKKIKKESMFFG